MLYKTTLCWTSRDDDRPCAPTLVAKLVVVKASCKELASYSNFSCRVESLHEVTSWSIFFELVETLQVINTASLGYARNRINSWALCSSSWSREELASCSFGQEEIALETKYGVSVFAGNQIKRVFSVVGELVVVKLLSLRSRCR